MKNSRKLSLGFLLVGATALCLMGASGGCGSDLHKAATTADSIASSLNTAASINHQLIVSGQESAAEGAVIAKYIDATAKANDAFIGQISQAETSGGQVNAASIVSALGALTTTAQQLQSQGVLGIKSQSARTAFTAVMGAINSELAVLQGLIQVNTSENHSHRRDGLPLVAALALTPEEIAEIIGIISAAAPAATQLIQKLLQMKGEADSDLLADAKEQDAAAEKQAEADEQPAG